MAVGVTTWHSDCLFKLALQGEKKRELESVLSDFKSVFSPPVLFLL